MRINSTTRLTRLLAGALLACAPALADSAFVVQARVKQNGALLTGTADVRATLFDAQTGGNLLAGPVRLDEVVVNQGLMNLRLDFGATFAGPCFLEIELRAPHDPTDTAPLTRLNGRIEITPSPKALTADGLSVPAVLSGAEPIAPILTVENTAGGSGAVAALLRGAVRILGRLTVGTADQFSVDPNSGDVLSAGNIVATGGLAGSVLDIVGSASIGLNADVGGNANVAGTVDVGSSVNVGVDVNAGGNLNAFDLNAFDDLNVTDDAFVGGDATISGNLSVAFDVFAGDDLNALDDAFVNDDANIGGDLAVVGAYVDSGSSSGTQGQFLSSTATGTQWRNIGDTNLDMMSNAITNIGAGGTSFGADGSLLLMSDLLVTGPGGIVLNINAAAGQLTMGQNTFVVDAATGDTGIGGDLAVVGAYVDSGSSSGTQGQFLSSTATGTQWRNIGDTNLDMMSNAITNIGAGGTSFGADGSLMLVGDLLVTGPGGIVLNINAAAGLLTMGQNTSFVVDAATGDTGIGGHLDLDGPLFDVTNSVGSAGQLLSSTGAGVMWVDPPAGGGDGQFDNITVGNTANFGADAQNPTAQIKGTTGEGIFGGAVEPQAGVRDEAGSLGAPGQLLSSTGDGVLWVDCNCSGGGASCITCNGNDAQVNGHFTAIGSITAHDNFLLVDSTTSEQLASIDASTATFTVPLSANASFNFVRNMVSDKVQVSDGNPSSPALDVVATADFAPLVRIFNFLGAALALQVQGDMEVTGSLSKGGGSFKIDHPLDPANKYLYHSFVESPDMLNIYNGNVFTDERGYAVIELPAWFEALNGEFRYQLTVIDDADTDEFVLAKVVQRIENNSFVIRTSEPGVEVSWQVTGVRRDPWAEANRIPVEQWKSDGERGRYLHPEVRGLPAEMGIDYDAGKARGSHAADPQARFEKGG